MEALLRTTENGQEEVLTGLGWQVVVHGDSELAPDHIPIVDLADMYHKEIRRRKAVARAICDACANSGFLYAKNHGLPDDEIAMDFSEAKLFS
jgi:hypothetical protein